MKADNSADPRIGIIRVDTITATYAIVNRSAVGRGVEIAKGAVTGEAPSVNKLREVTEQEIAECRFHHLAFRRQDQHTN